MQILKVSIRMAIKQVIEFASDARYFGGFLQALIEESGIVGSVEQQEGSITLCIQENDPAILEQFVLSTQKYLPHSFFLGEIQSFSNQEFLAKTSFSSPSYKISPCQKCLQALSDPASEDYLNQDLICKHYMNSDALVFEDAHYYSPHYTEGSALLVVDPQTVSELFLMTQKERETLFSIEKPSLKVRIADTALQEICKKEFISIQAPSSVKSALVALNAKESGVEYLFFAPIKSLEVAVSKENVRIIRDTLGLSKSLQNLQSDPVLNRFVNIAQELDPKQKKVGVYLSQKGEVCFLYHDQKESKKLFSFSPFDAQAVLYEMQENETQQRLLEHFFAKYPSIATKLDHNKKLGIFEFFATLLDLDLQTYDALSESSLLFYGNGGLKIDMNFSDGNFDYPAMVGSFMSFKLADTPTHYLAYSLFEAFGDMVIATLMQLRSKYNAEQFVMMGSMFENSVLYSRILSRFSQYNPYFSKGFALDD